MYQSQGRYAQAEPLFQKVLQASQEILGENHFATIISLNNLGSLYSSQGRYAEAEPLFQKALKWSQEVLGKKHPSTITSLNNLAGLYILQDKAAKALKLLEETEEQLFSYTFSQINNLLQPRVRRLHLSLNSTFQDLAFNLAIQSNSKRAKTSAANVLLRWKHLEGEEQAFVANLAQTSDNPAIVQLSQKIMQLRSQFSLESNRPSPIQFLIFSIQNRLEKKELQLRRMLQR